MKKILILAALVSVLVLVAVSSLGEQRTSETYINQSDVLSSGSTGESSSSYGNYDSLGQNAAGSSESAGYRNFFGFIENITESNDGWIRGSVTLSGEADHSGALVEAYVLGRMYATAETSSTGTYTMRVLAGTYSVEANKPGYEINGYSGSVTVVKGSTVEGINMTLGKAWPMFHQDLHKTGNSPEKNLTPPLNLKWTYNAGSTINTSPIVGEGKVFISAGQKILAVGAADGALKWSYTFGSSGRNIYKSLCYYKGIVYGFVNYDKKLIALNASDGSLRFSYTISDPSTSNQTMPVAARGVLYFGAGFTATTSPKVYAINAYTGAFLWSFDVDPLYNYVEGTYTLVDNNLYFTARGVVYIQCMAYDLDPATGTPKWNSSPGYIARNGLAYSGGKLFATNAKTEIFCMDASNGEKLWSYPLNYYYDDYQIPAVSGDAIYVGSSDNKLYGLSADGALQWSSNVGSWAICSPALALGHVYFTSASKNIYAARVSDGALAWSYNIGTMETYEKKSPAIVDGYLYAASFTNTLYAFESNATPEAPSLLAQYQADGSTPVTTGEWTGGKVVLKMSMSDPNNYDALYPEVEVRITPESFLNSTTSTGGAVSYSGSAVTGAASQEGLINLSGYHWQARVRDAAGARSGWVAFGGNQEGQPDLVSDTISPETPTTLEAVALPSSSPTYVRLDWHAATDEAPGSGFAGYNFYRSPTSTEGFVRKNTAVMTTVTTNDSSVLGGNNYYFVITSKDMAGNESGYSNVASAPNLIISKTISVEAPTAGGYGGSASDAVPGATVTYSINYSNSGFAPAASLTMIDRIPDFTEYKMGSATGEAVSSIAFSNNNGASYAYTPTGEAVDSSVTNIKWNCRNLSVGGNSTVTFEVVIK